MSKNMDKFTSFLGRLLFLYQRIFHPNKKIGLENFIRFSYTDVPNKLKEIVIKTDESNGCNEFRDVEGAVCIDTTDFQVIGFDSGGDNDHHVCGWYKYDHEKNKMVLINKEENEKGKTWVINPNLK